MTQNSSYTTQKEGYTITPDLVDTMLEKQALYLTTSLNVTLTLLWRIYLILILSSVFWAGAMIAIIIYFLIKKEFL